MKLQVTQGAEEAASVGLMSLMVRSQKTRSSR